MLVYQQPTSTFDLQSVKVAVDAVYQLDIYALLAEITDKAIIWKARLQ